jgi:hypothetical protein
MYGLDYIKSVPRHKVAGTVLRMPAKRLARATAAPHSGWKFTVVRWLVR